MPEIVRYVVWHPEHKQSYTEPTELNAWLAAYKAMPKLHENHATSGVLRSLGWRCSEVRADG